MPNRRDIARKLRELESDVSPAGMEIVIRTWLVMSREQAEREGRTILGSSEEAVDPGYVRMPAGEISYAPIQTLSENLTSVPHKAG